ncbi:hypothetical protein ACFLT1_07445 [Bacteroidota bacterium]
MKKLALTFLPFILLSCANKSDNTETGLSPKGFIQTTYLLDTLAENQVFQELKNITEVKLTRNGEVESVVQTMFSFEHQDGIIADGNEIYSPDSFFKSELSSIYEKYDEQGLADTIIIDGRYTYEYDEKSQLISFREKGGWNEIHFIYDQHGQWTQSTLNILEERSGHISYEITKREFQYNDKSIISVTPPYLTVNDVDIFKKEKKSIVDYYILLRKAGIFNPGNYGGSFDASNGFFEFQDEGTGAGLYTGQLALFRTNDGNDIIAISGYSQEAWIEYYLSANGDRPNFYLFKNNLFTELTEIFPEVNKQLFLDENDTISLEQITTYFTLPQKGLAIRYNVDDGLGVFCDKLEIINDAPAYYVDICRWYSSLSKTYINIEFDKVSGTFNIKY